MHPFCLPNNIFVATNLSPWHVLVFVYVCLCLCVIERESERGRGSVWKVSRVFFTNYPTHLLACTLFTYYTEHKQSEWIRADGVSGTLNRIGFNRTFRKSRKTKTNSGVRKKKRLHAKKRSFKVGDLVHFDRKKNQLQQLFKNPITNTNEWIWKFRESVCFRLWNFVCPNGDPNYFLSLTT